MAVLPKLWALRDGSKLQLHFGLHGAPSEPGPVDADDVEATKYVLLALRSTVHRYRKLFEESTTTDSVAED